MLLFDVLLLMHAVCQFRCANTISLTRSCNCQYMRCTLLQACDGANAAVVVIGSSMIENEKSADGFLRPAHEGEGLDRNNLDLPGRQADLLRALARRAPGLPVVVVLFNGGGLDVGWIDRMPAVSAMMAAGFPGQVRNPRNLATRLYCCELFYSYLLWHCCSCLLHPRMLPRVSVAVLQLLPLSAAAVPSSVLAGGWARHS